MADWQVDWLRGALASGIREAGLSVARKNGKSGLVAALVLAHLVGPLRRPAWRAVVCSLTGNLAKELRRQVEEIARASGLYDAEAAAASHLSTWSSGFPARCPNCDVDWYLQTGRVTALRRLCDELRSVQRDAERAYHVRLVFERPTAKGGRE